MAITDECGPHCGIIADPVSGHATERHCGCADLCHNDSRLIRDLIRDKAGIVAGARMTMADHWYERAADGYRPWLHWKQS